MKEIIFEYRFILIAAVAAVVYALFNWAATKKLIYAGILRAKSLAKDCVLNSGQEQEDWVVEKIYPLLPAVVRVIVSEAFFRILVKRLYDAAKDILEDGTWNGRVNEGG